MSQDEQSTIKLVNCPKQKIYDHVNINNMSHINSYNEINDTQTVIP